MQPMRYRLLTAALGLALATPAVAQEAPAAPAAEEPATTAPAPPATPEAPASAPAEPAAPATDGSAAPTADGTSATPGAPAPAQPEVQEIVRDTFGDWQVRCAPQGDECFMYQLALDAAKNPVAEVSILRLPEAAEADAGVTVVTPLGTLLTSGVTIQVDGGEKRQYPFAWCSQVGCFARFGLDNPTVGQFKRGKAGSITLIAVGKPQEPVNLALSLSGFTAAYESLQVPPSPPAPAAPLPSLAPKP